MTAPTESLGIVNFGREIIMKDKSIFEEVGVLNDIKR